jgi:hypothetical protein
MRIHGNMLLKERLIVVRMSNSSSKTNIDCIDIAINDIEKANMASLKEITCSNLIFLDMLSVSA